MKRIIVFVLLVLECLSLFAIVVHLFRYYANSQYAFVIYIPEGMQLTLNTDYVVETDDGSLILPEGTSIVPTYVFPNDVCFEVESSKGRLHVDWKNIIEQVQLNELLETAKHNRQIAQKPTIIKGYILSVIICLAHLIIGTVISLRFLRKQKLKVLFGCHVVFNILLYMLVFVTAGLI